MKRIPNTIREYSKAIPHNGVTIYKTHFGWQVLVKQATVDATEDPFWLATKSTLKGARQFIDNIATEGRKHIFA